MKNNKKLLWDFTNNKKIPKNITDYNFYIDAINITNDKELYYKCPKEIQTNYDFILYLLDKFKDDKEFINEVAQYYLSNTKMYNYQHQELLIIMSNLINNPNDKYYYHYQNKKNNIYLFKTKIIERLLKEENNSEDLGLGFVYVLENEKSEVITNFLATKFIERIFYNIITLDELEKIIHITYKDRLDFVTYGIDKFIIEFISNFDGYLAYYTKNNMYLTNDIKKDIKTIMRRWRKYIKENYNNQIEQLEKAIKEIISKNNSSLSILEIYDYIDKKNLLIPVKLLDDDYEEEVNNLLSNKRVDIKDYQCLKESIEITEKIFNCKEEKSKNKYKNKAKILEFKPNKKE